MIAPGTEPDRSAWRPDLRPRLVLAYLGAAAVLVMVGSLLAVLAYELLDFSALLRLDADAEKSVPAWFQSGLLLLNASLWMAVAHSERGVRRRALPWLLLGLVFLVGSVDEIISAHEELTEPLRGAFGTSGLLYYAWVIPGAVLAAAVTLVVARPVLSLPPSVRRLIIVAGALYVAGVMGVELVGGLIADTSGEDGLGYRLSTQVEEALESAGLVTLAYGLVTLLALRQGAAGGHEDVV